jgi:hypothetical protein
MLRQPGNYGDILRVIGRLLDERDVRERPPIHPAHGVGTAARPTATIRDMEIIDHESFMTVYWTSEDAVRQESYMDDVISNLLAEARARRGQTDGYPAGELSDLLRTLGEELDGGGIVFNGVVEKDDAFVVSGIANGRYVNQSYPHEELRALRRRRQPHRASRADEPAARARQESVWRSPWQR